MRIFKPCIYRLSILIAFVFSFLFSHNLFSQSLNYIHYTTFDGLPSQVVYSVLQDQQGFIWFGTENGLCRFDGKNFKTYTTDDGMPDNEVLQLFEDKKGRIWLSLFNGGACYFYQNKFYTQQNDSLLAQIKGIRNFTNYFFPNNRDWFGIYGGNKLFTLTYDLKIIASYDDYVFGKATSFPDPNNNQLFTKKIIEFENGKISKSIPLTWLKPNLTKYLTSKFILNRHYINWSVDKKLEVNIMDSVGNLTNTTIVNFNYSIDNIIKVDNYFYVTTYNQVLLRYFETDTLLQNPEVFLKGKTFNRIIKDNEGGYWVTSIDDGVYYIPSRDARIYNNKSGVLDNGIYSIFEFQNQIYFTDSKGNIYKANPFEKIIALGDGDLVLRIRGTLTDSNKVYFATDRGVFEYNASSKTANRISYITSTKDLVKKGDRLFYVSNGGLFAIDFKKIMEDTISLGRKTTIAIDKKNNIWFGELNGLFVLKNNDSIYNYGISNSLLRTRISSIKVADDGIVWAATQANGLIGLKNDSIHFVFSRQNGLTTNNLKSIFVSKNTVCIATDKGVDLLIYSLVNKSFSVRHISKFDGLADNDVNGVYLKNDTLYAGTAQGFSVIPLNIKKNKIPPVVHITGFNINNHDTTFPRNFILEHNQNNLIISYIGLSYSSAGNINYRYRLFKYDPYTYTQSTSVTFAELSPGNYNFEIGAQNASGVWSNNPAMIAFTIEPPFWKRISFLFGISLFGAALIAMLYYYRLKKFRRELQLQNRILHSEIKALRAQMNPHFIFNSLNSIQQFIFTNKKEEANEYLSEFAKLMRMMLDHSKENFISVTEEVEFIKLYLKLEQLRLSQKFSYEIIFNDEQKINACYIPSMVLQPFVENAIVHGLAPKKNEQGKLEINFNLIAQDLLCTITDNGVGRTISKQSSSNSHSFAIKATSERINAINAAHRTHVDFKIIDLTNNENNPTGTRIEIQFPDINTY
jgi:Histidine kinase/Y_Y_Y domain/Two component regulator propeller